MMVGNHFAFLFLSFVVGSCWTITVVHYNLPQSELTSVVERSWTQNGFSVTKMNGQFEEISDSVVVFILRPYVINLCSADGLQRQLQTDRADILVDDVADPNILIGDVATIREHLNGTDVKLTVDEDVTHVLHERIDVGMKEDNTVYHYLRQSSPCILSVPPHKLNLLFRFANYIPNVNTMTTWPGSYNWHGYCHICDEILETPTNVGKGELVVIVGYIFQWTPLLYNWLSTLLNQEVKSNKFYIIYNNVTEHNEVVEDVTKNIGYDGLVLDKTFFKDKELSDLRKHSTVMCGALQCSYMFTVDSEVALLRRDIITHLAQFNKSVITALVSKGRERFNFWGDITENGWYQRSPDYFDIVDGAWGLFVVPYIKSMYLTRSDALPDYDRNDRYDEGT